MAAPSRNWHPPAMSTPTPPRHVIRCALFFLPVSGRIGGRWTSAGVLIISANGFGLNYLCKRFYKSIVVSLGTFWEPTCCFYWHLQGFLTFPLRQLQSCALCILTLLTTRRRWLCNRFQKTISTNGFRKES